MPDIERRISEAARYGFRTAVVRGSGACLRGGDALGSAACSASVSACMTGMWG